MIKDRFSIEDNTTSTGGYCRVLLDGQEICLEAFPFRRGADPRGVKAMTKAVVEVLNAAEICTQAGAKADATTRLTVATGALRNLMNDSD